MAGNTLGSRRYYLYTDDVGNTYSYQTDQDLGDAVSATLDDSNPPLPRRFKPRGVYCEAEIDGELVRKFLVIGDVNASLYASNASQSVTVDTVSFKTTGRKGEQATFGSNPDDDDSGGTT